MTFRCLLVLALFALLFNGIFAEKSVWPPETDIAPDPAVVSGQLPNGLRYAVLENSEPRDRASVRMLVGAGSLDETDEERGLAHYLEHMAFNGTENFPADTLVEWFQRNGMAFGADSNAATGFETTTYMLELPHSDVETLDEGLSVLRDFADRMLIEEGEVEKERGIIFSEKRARDSVEFRTAMAEFAFILPETLPPERFPIGVTETLEAADAETLRGYLERWYRPDNIILAVVGEVDVPTTQSLIEEKFSSMEADGSMPDRADRGTIEPLAEPLAAVHREPEASSVSVSLQVAAPWERPPDSIEARFRDLPLDAANAIISRRLAELAKKENAPFNFGAAGASEAFDFARIASIELTGPPDRWREALALAEQELRRALMYGFSPVELAEIKANIVNSLEEATRSASTRRSSGLAGALVNAIYRDLVFTTPETDLTIARPSVEALTPEAVVAALQEAWAASAPRVFVSGKLEETASAADAIAVLKASRAEPVEPPETPKEQDFAYTDFGSPGEVVSRQHIEDLDLWLVCFANGVRLNLKKTDFRANSISMLVRLGGGQLQIPLDQPELALVASPFLNEGGLGAHTREELRRVLAGRTVRLNFAVDEDAFLFTGGTSPKDLELTLQLLSAYLLDAGWREDGVGVIRRSISQYYDRLIHLTAGVAQMEIPPLLASGDPRFGLPPLEAVLETDPSDVSAWLDPIFAGADIEIALVGDLDIDQTIALAAAAVGALPARLPPADFSETSNVHYPDTPPVETFTVDTEILKAQVLVYWPTDDASDIQRVRRLTLLASIVRDRLRREIREELGAAYSPSASSSNSDAFPGYGLFAVSVEVDPPETKTIQKRILEIAGDLQAHGVTGDELERAREPILTAIRQSIRENGYWLNAVLARAQSKPEYLEYARNRENDMRAITKEELDTLAAQYLVEANAARFIVTPAAAEAPPTKAAAAAEN